MSKIKLLWILTALVFVLTACAQPAPVQQPAPAAAKATEAPKAADTPKAAATPAALSAGPLKDVPRSKTLNLAWSISSPIGVTNPWASPGYTHQEANAMMWEGLSYYLIYANKELPWLAETMTYSKPDFTELTIKVRKDAKWSDGAALTAKDVAFTFEGQMKNEKLPYHAQFKTFVQEVKMPDDFTVVVSFKIPAPRFKFEVLTLKFDTGIPIVPAHILSKQADVNAFLGGLDMPHSGPYNTVVWDQNQKILDLREDWWAIKAGLVAVPDVKRIVMTNIGGQVGQNMDTVAQRVVNNEYDATLDMRSAVIGNILKQNAKVTTHTGNKPPYGYLDWWPNSLWVNTQLAPYDDARVRRAMSLVIDRNKLNDMVYEGAKVSTIYPFPLYPNLVKFTELPAMKALVDKYLPAKFDPAESTKLMTEAGFAKNSAGLWAKGTQTVNATIQGFEGIHSDIVPILVEMLRQGGFDANVNFGTDAYNNMADGKPGLYMFGHGASLIDPAATLDLYNGRYSAAIGTTAGSNRFSRYKNPEYDKIVDAMAPLSSDDPKFTDLAIKAMEIYWRDVLDIPIIQWLHRIPYNQTYWTNWPTEANLGVGCNGAFWHHTGMLVITSLKGVQK
jgi:ABC-type transport system substrate-binding protein